MCCLEQQFHKQACYLLLRLFLHLFHSLLKYTVKHHMFSFLCYSRFRLNESSNLNCRAYQLRLYMKSTIQHLVLCRTAKLVRLSFSWCRFYIQQLLNKHYRLWTSYLLCRLLFFRHHCQIKVYCLRQLQLRDAVHTATQNHHRQE